MLCYYNTHINIYVFTSIRGMDITCQTVAHTKHRLTCCQSLMKFSYLYVCLGTATDVHYIPTHSSSTADEHDLRF